MTAAVRLPLGDIRESAESWAMFQRLLTEVVVLGRAEGVPLDQDVVARQLDFAATLPPDSYSSLHHDLVTGRRMELDALHGTVVRRAGRAGIPAPSSESVYAGLRPWQLRNEPG